jgi:hypothetical protein
MVRAKYCTVKREPENWSWREDYHFSDYCLNSEHLPFGGWGIAWNDLAETFSFSVT